MDRIELPAGYSPTEEEEFMNPLQLEYFRRKLLKWKQYILEECGEIIENFKETTLPKTDLIDRASEEEELRLDVRSRDRAMKLIAKIDHALRKIENGTYGYCEISGKPISIERLKARPVATMCLESQEEHEKYKREHVS